MVRMIVGKYEQRVVYKCYIVVNNGPDGVLEAFGAMFKMCYKKC